MEPVNEFVQIIPGTNSGDGQDEPSVTEIHVGTDEKTVVPETPNKRIISGINSGDGQDEHSVTDIQVSTDEKAIVPETPNKRKKADKNITTPVKKTKSEPNTPGDTQRNVSSPHQAYLLPLSISFGHRFAIISRC
jgi:hypothetical protein